MGQLATQVLDQKYARPWGLIAQALVRGVFFFVPAYFMAKNWIKGKTIE